MTTRKSPIEAAKAFAEAGHQNFGPPLLDAPSIAWNKVQTAMDKRAAKRGGGKPAPLLDFDNRQEQLFKNA